VTLSETAVVLLFLMKWREEHKKWKQKAKNTQVTSSIQNRQAALMKVAGMTINLQSSHRTTGRVKCHSTRIRDVRRV
jgi:hypothetical protein